MQTGGNKRSFDGIYRFVKSPVLKKRTRRFGIWAVLLATVLGLITSATMPSLTKAEPGYAAPNRLWTSGAELGGATDGLEVAWGSISGLTTSSSVKRSGSYSFHSSTVAGGAMSSATVPFSASNMSSRYWMRAYVYLASLPSGTTSLINFQTNGSTNQISVRLNSSGYLILYNVEDSAQIGNLSTTKLATSRWYRVELGVNTTTLASTTAEMRIDGLTEASGTVNLANGVARISFGGGFDIVSVDTDVYFDDLALNGSSERLDNWPGEGRVVALRPNASGDSSGWTGTYAEVDDTPPNDNTDGISDNSGASSFFNITDSSTAGLTSTDIVKMVSLGVRFACAPNYGGSQGSCGGTATFTAGIKPSSGGTTESSGSISTTSTTWYTNETTATTLLSPLTLYDLPGTTDFTKWNTSYLDSAQIGVTESSASAVSGVSALWLTVEYASGGGGRVWSSGAELGSATAGMEATNSEGSGTKSISSATYRSGAYSYSVVTSSNTGAFYYDYASSNQSGKYWFRTYVMISTAPGATATILMARSTDNTNRISVRLTSAGLLQLYNEEDSAQIGSDSSTALTVGSGFWYRLELYVDTTTLSATSAELRLDGATVASSAGGINLAAGIARYAWGQSVTSTTSTILYDDIAINTNIGTYQNSWPGEGKIVHLRVTSAGDYANWTNTYTAVDEIPPNDATDSITETTSGDIFDGNCADPTGITDYDLITLVSAGVRFNAAAAAEEDFAVRLKGSASGPAIESQAIKPATTTWTTNAASGPANHPLTAYTSPDSDANWDINELYLMQVGVRDLGGSGTVQVTSLWSLVEYQVQSGGRLWSSGYEQNSTTANMEWSSYTGSGTIQTSTVRSGTYAYQTTTGGAQAYSQYSFATSTTNITDPLYVRTYFRVGTAVDGTSTILKLLQDTGGGGTTARAAITLSSSNTLQLVQSGVGNVGSASSALTTGTWYRIEILYSYNGGTNGTLTARIDGTDFATSSSLSLGSGVGVLQVGNNIDSGSLTTGQLQIDDVAINQGIRGVSQVSWPGEGKIAFLRPNAAGDTSTFTNGYANIDENPPNDATDYAYSTTSGNTLYVNIDDPNTIPQNASISMVAVGGRFNTAAATQETFRFAIKPVASGTALTSDLLNVASTTWKTNQIASPYNYKLSLYGQTTVNREWTTSRLGTTQIGVINQGNGTGTIQVTALWLMVEYKDIDDTTNSDSGYSGSGRLYSNGMELGSVTAGMEWEGISGTPTADTTTVRTGTYSMKATSVSGIHAGYQNISAVNVYDTFYARTYFRAAAWGDSPARLMSFDNVTPADRVWLRVDASGNLSLIDEDGTIGSSTALSLNTWYRLELKVDLSAGAGSSAHVIEARVDGVSFASSSTRAISSGIGRLYVGQNAGASAVAAGSVAAEFYFDDVALNSRYGSYENTWPGAGGVVHLHANAAGDYANWTNTYANVDDRPPNDGTDVVYASQENKIIDVNVTDSTLSSSDIVKFVSVGVRYNSNASAESIIKTRLKSSSFGTVKESNPVLAETTTYRTNYQLSPYFSQLYTRYLPGTTTAWTDSTLDTAQVGVRYVDGLNRINVSALWLQLEYVPAVGLNISGTVYSNDGSTAYDCSANNLTIHAAVNGGTTQNTTCTAAGGTYSFTGITGGGTDTPFAVWIDSAATPQATTVSLTAAADSSITGLNLYSSRLITRSETSTAITNAHLATADNTDAGIRYAVSAGNLTTDSGIGLYVWGTDTFAPGGTVTTSTTSGDVIIPTTATLNMAGNALNIGGSYSQTGTFTSGSNITTFTATSTGKTVNRMLGATNGFYDLVFNGTGGGWQFAGTAASNIVTNDLTVTAGSVDFNGKTFNITRDLVIADSASATLTAGTATIYVSRHWTRGSNATVTVSSSTVYLNGTGTISGGLTQFGSVYMGYSGYTTTITATRFDVMTYLSFNGGTVDGQTVGGQTQVIRGSTGGPVVFNSPTTLTGSDWTIIYRTTVGGITIDIAGGNYGTWNIGTDAQAGSTTLYRLGAAVTTTGGIYASARTGTDTTGFNTQGYAVTAKYLRMGWASAGYCAETIFTLSSSTVTLSNGANNALYSDPSCGNGTISFNTSTVYVAGNVDFQTGNSVTVNYNTSTLVMQPGAGITNTYDAYYQYTPYNFIVNGNSTGSVQPSFTSGSSLLWIANDLTMTSGSLIGTANVQVNGNVAGTAGVINLTGGDFSLKYSAAKNFGTTSGSAAWTFNNLRFENTGSAGYTVTTQTGGTGSITVNGVLYLGDTGDTYATTLNAGNRNWILAGTTGDPFQFLASPLSALVGGTSKFTYSGNYASGNTTIQSMTSSYYDLEINNSGETYVLEGNTTVDNNLTITAGTLDVTTTNYALNVGGSWSNSGTFTARSGTVSFTATGTGKTLGGTMTSTSAFYNLAFTGTGGGWTYAAAVEASHDFTVSAGTVDADTTNHYNLTVGNNFLLDTNGVYMARASTITVTGNWTQNSAAWATSAHYGTSTVVLKGASNTVAGAVGTGSWRTFYNLTIYSGAVITQVAGTPVRVVQDLNIQGSYTPAGDCSGSNFTAYYGSSGAALTIAGTLGGTQCFNVYSTSDPTVSYTGTISISNIGYFAGGNLTIPAYTYGGNLAIHGSSSAITYTIGAGTMSINNSFSIHSYSTGSFIVDNTVNNTNFTINDKMNFPSNSASSIEFKMGSATYNVRGNWQNLKPITVTPGTSTVNRNSGVSSYTIQSGGQSFYNYTLNQAGHTDTLLDDFSVTNNMTITAGTFNTGASNYAVAIGGNYSNSGTYTANSSTTTFNATDTGNTLAGTMTGTSAFYNLTFNGGSGAEWTPSAAVAVTNDLTMTVGTLLGTQNITVNGNVVGTSGIINLTGGTFRMTATGNRTFGTTSGSANWTFYNLTFEDDDISYRTFSTNTGGSGSITVSGALNVTFGGGNMYCVSLGAGNRNWIISGTSGTPLVLATGCSIDGGTSTFTYAGNYASGNTTLWSGMTSPNFYNLVLNNASETYTPTVVDLAVTNDLTITAGTLDVTTSNFNVSVGGNWSNSGTFTPRSGKVTLKSKDASSKNLNPGGSSFNNLEVDNGLVGYWKFDEGTGTTAADLSVSNKTATVSAGSPTWTSSTPGSNYYGADPYAATFAGSDTFQAPDSANQRITNNFTVSLWFKSSNTSQTNKYLLQKTTGSNQWAVIYNYVSNKVEFYCFSGGCASGDPRPNSQITVSDTNWHLITYTYDGTTWTGYLDGSQAYSVSQSFVLGSLNAPINFGSATGANYVSGNLDDVRIYNRPITASEVSSLYAGTNPTTGTYTLQGNLDVNGNLGLRTGKLDVSATNYSVNLAGNYTNISGFAAQAGTVTLDGAATQAMTGWMTGTSAFNNLTITNNSGTSASDNERTSFVASVDFNNSATISGTYTINTANTRVEYNSGSTYTVTNIAWNGQATGTKIYFRNSAVTGTWLLNVSGTQSVSYVNVSRSNASGGSEINASNGTNYNAGNNTNWYFTQTISGVVYASDETTPILTAPAVRIKINGAGTGAAYVTNASGTDGSYSLTVPVRAGETISLYLDTNGGISGATVTVAPSADVSSVAIVQNALSTRCDNTCSLTNTNIDYYDKGNDSDIHATVTTGALTVDSDWKTIIKANTFAPGGNVTSVGGFHVKAGAEYSGGSYVLTVYTANIAGTFTPGTSTLYFDYICGVSTIGTTLNVYNLTINCANASYGVNVTAGQTFVATGTVTLTNGWFKTGTIQAYGDVTFGAGFDGSWENSGAIEILGSATRSMTLAGGGNFLNVLLNAANVTLNGPASGYASIGDFTIQAGAFVNGAGTLHVENYTRTGGSFTDSSGTIEAGYWSVTYDVPTTETFNNLTIKTANYNYSFGVAAGDTIVVNGTLSLESGKFTNTGIIEAYGNVTNSSGFASSGNSSGTISIVGAASRTITFTGNTGGNRAALPNMILNAVNATVNGPATGTYLTMISLNIQAGAFVNGAGTLAIEDDYTRSGGSFQDTQGTVTLGYYNLSPNIDVPTSETFNNLTFVAVNCAVTATIASGDNLIVNGTLTYSSENVTGGSLEAKGNVVHTGTCSTTTPLTFSGSAVQTFDPSSTANNVENDITISKSGGEVDLTRAFAYNTTNQDLIINTGTFDLNGYALTRAGTGTTLSVNNGGNFQFQGGETLTLPSNPTLNSGSTVTYDGTVGPYTIKNWSYSNLTINGSGATFNLPAATTAGGNLTISAGTLDTVSGSNYALNVGGNWTNNGTFTARSGTVTLNGSSAQGLNGTMTGGSAFYNLTVTNNSGTSASDNERTGFVSSVDFNTAATITGTYTITTANVRVEYEDNTAYTVNNINWNGQATGTKIYFRSSVAGSGAWLLAVSGTQTAVSYINVSRSNANSGNEINASNGTNYDAGNNQNWYFARSISGVVYGTDETTPNLTGPTVRVKVNGTGTYSTTASTGDGSFTISNVPTRAGEILAVYLDTAGGITGATYTAAIAGDQTGVDIVLSALSTRCDNSCVLTNTNIDTWDKGNDADIHATVTGGALAVDSDWSLIVKANTFAPGGNVTVNSQTLRIKATGSFTAPSGTLTIGDDYVNEGGTFTHNGGTVVFDTSSTWYAGVSINVNSSESFNNLTIASGSSATYTIASGDVLNVAGTFTVTNSNPSYTGTINGGTIDCYGTIAPANNGLAGTTVMELVGTGVRNVDFSAGGYLLALVINSSTVSVAGPTTGNTLYTKAFTLQAGTYTNGAGTTRILGNFIHTAGGSFADSSGTVVISGTAWYEDRNVDVATSETFNNLTFAMGPGATWTIGSGDTLTVNGIFTISNSSSSGTTINGGTINCNGTIVPGVYGGLSGSTVVAAVGASSRTIDFSAGGYLTNFVLNSSGASVSGPTTGNTMNIVGGFTISAGTYTNGAGNTYVYRGNYTHTAGGSFIDSSGTFSITGIGWGAGFVIDVASTETFNNLSLIGATNTSNSIASGDVLTVNGNLSFTSDTSYPGSTSGGSITVLGNVTHDNNDMNITTPITFSGSNTQTFNPSDTGNLFDGDITVNKSGGTVNLTSYAFAYNATNQDLTITAGTFDISGYALTRAGTGTTLSVGSGGNFQLMGGETLTLPTNPTLSSGSTVTYNGTSGPYTLQNWSYSNLTINGSGATFNLPAITTVGNDLTITAGTLDSTAANSYALNIGGSYSNAGIYTANSNTTTFTSTASGKTLSGTLNGTSSFYDLVFNGVAGAWSFGAAVNVNRDFTVTNGAVTASNNNLTVVRDFTLANTTGVSYSPGSATVTISRDYNDLGYKLVYGTSTIAMIGDGSVHMGSSGISYFYNLSIAYTGKTTNLDSASVTRTIHNLAFNGGIANGVTGYMDVSCSATGCYPVTFNSATSLTGTFSLGINSPANGYTINVAAGNYGTWDIKTWGYKNNVTFQMAGAVSTTGSLWIRSATTYTGNAFNTGGYTLSAANIYIGDASNTGAMAVSLGASSVTSGFFGVYSNSGAHTLDMGSATIHATGDVKFVNGTGTITVTPGTSTLSMEPGASTTTALASNGQSLYNFTVNGNSTGSVQPSDAATVTNDLTMTAGSLIGTQNVTVNGNVAGTSGVINLTGGTFYQNINVNKNFGTTSGSAAWTFYNLTFDTIIMPRTITTQTGGTGSVTVSNVLSVGPSGNGLTLNAGNRTWILSGTTGDPFQMTGALTGATSTFTYTGNYASGNTTVQASASSYANLTINNASETYVLEGTTTVAGNLTITAGTLDVTTSNYALNVGGNWSNSGTFTARSGTVTLNGSATQTMYATMTGSSAFYNLTITNNSGASASDNERTGFTASVDFDTSATITGTYTITTANVRVEYNATSTYTITNINWNGQATGTRIYFRSSDTSSSWLLAVSGTQTAVSYVNVSRSNAGSGNQIIANDGTNYDATNNNNWLFTSGFNLSGTVYQSDRTSPLLTAPKVQVAVNGSLYSGYANASASDGTYTITNVPMVTGNSLTVFLNTDGGNRGTVFTRSTGAVMTGIDIYESNVTMRCDNASCSLTNTDIDKYDYSQDGDIMGRVQSGNYDTVNSSTLYIKANTYAPGGTVDTGYGTLTIASGATLNMGGYGLSIYVSYSNSGTFTSGSNTTTFTSTSTGKTLAGNMTGSSAFYNLTFNGSGGGWSFGANSAEVTNNFTITAGTVTAPSTTLTVAGSFSNSGTFTHNSGLVRLNSSASSSKDLKSNASSFNNLEIDNGLVDYWKFDENTGTTATDVSANSNNGTIGGTVAWTSSVKSNNYYGGTNSDPYGLTFDGSSTNVYKSTVSHNLASNYTIGAWVKTSYSAANQYIVQMNRSGSNINNEMIFRINTNGTLTLWDYGTGYGFGAGQSSVGTVNDGAWHYVTFVKNGLSGAYYIDGSASGTTTAAADVTIYGNDLCVGKDYRDNNSFMNGSMDDFRIYNRSLSATEISDLYAGNHPSYGTYTLIDALDVNGNLGVRTGKLDVSASNFAVNAAGNYSNVAGFGSQAGTFTMDATATGKTFRSDPSFYNLTFNGSGGAWTYQNRQVITNDYNVSAGAVTANNFNQNVTQDFTIANAASTTYAAGSSTLTIGRHFTSNYLNAFDEGTSTVISNGTGTITNNDNAGGFYNLSAAYSGYTTSVVSVNGGGGTKNLLTLNGGTYTLSSGYLNLGCSASTCTPLVFASPTALTSGGGFYFWPYGGASQTINVPAGNYGGFTLSFAFNNNNQTYQQQGNITTTGYYYFGSYGQTGSIYNTNSGSISAAGMQLGLRRYVSSSTINFGSSTVSLGTTGFSCAAASGSNAESWTLNMGSAQISDTGDFNLTSNTSCTIATYNADTSTLSMNPGASATRTLTTAGHYLYNLTINGNSTGTVTTGGTVTAINDLSVLNSTFSGTNNITIGGSATGTSGTISMTGGNFYMNPGIGVSGTVNFGGSQGWTFYDLTFNDASAGSSFVANGTGSITVTDVMKLGNDIADQAVIYGGSRTWTLSGTTGTPLLNVAGLFTPETSTVIYSGNYASGNTTVTTSSSYVTYYNLQVNNSLETYQTDGSLSVGNDLTITSGTLLPGSSAYTVTIGGNYSNSGYLSANSGTVIFNATDTGNTLTGTLTGSSAFYNLTFNGTGGEWTPSSTVTVNNDLTMTAGSLLGTQDFWVTGNVAGTNGIINLTGGTFYQYNGSSLTKNFGTTSGSANWTFATLQFNATPNSSYTINVASGGTGLINVTTQLILANTTGTAPPNAFVTVNAGNRTFVLSGTTGTPFAMGTKGNPTFNAQTSTVQYTGNYASGNTSLAAVTYYNLTVNNGSETYVQLGNTTVGNNLTITAGTYSTSASNYTLAIGGNYSNSGTFTANSSTVTLNGTGQQTLSGTMTGSSAFYNLTVTNVSGTPDPGCGTSFTPGVIFSASATATGTYTISTSALSAGVNVRYTSGSTYTFTNISWVGTATKKIQFRPSTTSAWNLVVSGTQSVSYVDVSYSNASGGNQIVANNGTNTNCGNTTNWLWNTPPNNPASMLQKKVTGGTTLATGDWTNETQVQFTATATDTDNPDTLYLCVEKDILGTSFSNTEDSCGSGVAYSGSGVTVTVTITSQTDASEYHWQARVKDAAGAYSSWVSYGSNLESVRDYGIDTTAPTGGAVYDGTVAGVDAEYNDGSLTDLSANWDSFNNNVSGINRYEYSIGTTAGGIDMAGWVSNSTLTSIGVEGLNLHTNVKYFFNVRAVDNAGNTSSVVSSNAQWVLPMISFSLGSNSVSFSDLNGLNNYSDTKTSTLTTSTNAYGGYVISQYTDGLLRNGSTTIPFFSAGTYASPSSWPAGTCTGSYCGFGYTSSDTTIGGTNKFGTGTLYAPYSTTAAGDIVADHTDAVDGTTGPVTNEQFTITHKVAVSNLQPAIRYSAVIYYIVTGTF